NRVEIGLGSAVVREPVVVDAVQVMRGPADVRAGEPGDAVEVHARDAVRPAKTAYVLLRPRDAETVRVVLVHRPGAGDGPDDVLVDFRNTTVVDRRHVGNR